MTYDKTANELHRQSEAARDLIDAIRSDDAELNHDMIEGETSFLEAITAAIDEIDECEIIAEGCKAKENQIADRRRRTEARKERLRTLIEQAMLIADMQTVRLPIATLSVSKLPPKPVIVDEASVPAEYWKQPEPVLDKSAVNAAIKDGAEIPGVSMTNGSTSLKIRRA